MNVLVNRNGARVRLYRPYINEEETARNVSIFVPESSHNTGLYFTEPVDHLTGNSSAGRFTDSARSANFWWGMTPYPTTLSGESYAASLPNTYTSPRNMFERVNYEMPKYRTMENIYGRKTKQGPGHSGLAGY